jgi:hypothetical protein
MDELTISIPDGLNDEQKAKLAERLTHIATEAVREQGLKPGKQGSLMELAGCMKYNGPPISAQEAKARAMQAAADDYLGRES